MKPILFNSEMVRAILDGRKTQTRRIIKSDDDLKSQYKKGEVLYVRETFGIPIAMAGNVIYKADYENNAPLADGEKWRPSIHMPKKLARIFLEVTEVRIQRLKSITRNEAIAEGIKPKQGKFWYNHLTKEFCLSSPQLSFFSLWTSVAKANSSNLREIVFVYEFRRIAAP